MSLQNRSKWKLIKFVSPPKEKAKRSQWTSLDNLPILHVIGEPKLGFSKLLSESNFDGTWKNSILLGKEQEHSQAIHLIYLFYYFTIC